ncbi:soluble lytic murein transglycosylase-like protein [Chthonomonas calidirosea]|uniref:lytic transglycosylase domain-containing protein n=1 Tax=Chthonomonas calidirosea TaxID=454171 RepID=UPI0006DD484C|nr:lytic transglycosylase domain-containing protein [Chthonomonas calidirosea]CEK12410.1 soluble lytic murein transglycosylase-like protein [Chthonomonas calidirosea]
MMSHLEATLARIQQIESRLQMLTNPPITSAAASAPDPNTLSGMMSSTDSPPTSIAPFPLTLQAALTNSSTTAPHFAPYIEGLINKYAALNGLSPNLVRAVIAQESDGNPKEVSNKGAMGLMQLMPEEVQEFGVTDPFDPEQNIAAGTRLLAGLLRKFNGSLPLALAAYNAGAHAVQKYNGIPPYPETQNYVRRILGMLGQQPSSP